MTTVTNIAADMKKKQLLYAIIAFSIFILYWKLITIEAGVDNLQILKSTLEVHKDQLQLSEQQLLLIEQLTNKKTLHTLPIIYAITPTYWRYVQKAELTRISQTLRLVPNIHWIVVEDSESKSDLVRNIINESKLKATHLNAKTPPFERLKGKDPRWKRHRGVEQRNAALKWLRMNYEVADSPEGVVYFMDDDNTYNVKLFDEIAKVKNVGAWPVGLVGGYNVEMPLLNPNGQIVGFRSGWKPDRPFAIDMAGFAIHLKLILKNADAWFSYAMEKGLQESEFLNFFTTKEGLEPLAANCTKVYVWHTRTEPPKVLKNITGIEV